MKTQIKFNKEAALEAIKAQAAAILNEPENNWVDSPEKLLIATLYKMAQSDLARIKDNSL